MDVDLVRELRKQARRFEGAKYYRDVGASLLRAADEIERLSAVTATIPPLHERIAGLEAELERAQRLVAEAAEDMSRVEKLKRDLATLTVQHRNMCLAAGEAVKEEMKWRDMVRHLQNANRQ